MNFIEKFQEDPFNESQKLRATQVKEFQRLNVRKTLNRNPRIFRQQ